MRPPMWYRLPTAAPEQREAVGNIVNMLTLALCGSTSRAILHVCSSDDEANLKTGFAVDTTFQGPWEKKSAGTNSSRCQGKPVVIHRLKTISVMMRPSGSVPVAVSADDSLSTSVLLVVLVLHLVLLGLLTLDKVSSVPARSLLRCKLGASSGNPVQQRLRRTIIRK